MSEQPSLRSWRNSRASDFWWRSHESSPILSRLCHSRSWPRRQNKSAKSRKLRRLAKPVFGSSCVNLKGRNGVPSVCNTFNNVRVIRKQGVPHRLLWTVCPLVREIFKLLTDSLPYAHFSLYIFCYQAAHHPIGPSQNNRLL